MCISQSDAVPVLKHPNIFLIFRSTLKIHESGRHVGRVKRNIESIQKKFESIKTVTIFDWDVHMDNW